MISNRDFKGPGAFRVALNSILQLNMISLYSDWEWGLKLAFAHKSTW